MYLPETISAPAPFRVPAAERFLLVHALLVPLGFAFVALLVGAARLDQAIAAAFYDPQLHGFPARQWPLLEALGHRVAKSAVLGLWLLLFATAVASWFFSRLRPWASLLWATVLAMAVGPVLVVLLKSLNGYRCPWDLAQFGGTARATGGWFVSRIEAGQCFPSGHAAGGFSLVALYFGGLALGRRGWARAGLALTLVAGGAFSVVRMLQGAHFLSHNLWSAAIDWCAAALVYAPMLMTGAGGAAGQVRGRTS